MDRYELSEAQNGILTALLERRARMEQQINEQINELAAALRAVAGVGDDWVLTGNPQVGFVLVPPETMADEQGDD